MFITDEEKKELHRLHAHAGWSYKDEPKSYTAEIVWPENKPDPLYPQRIVEIDGSQVSNAGNSEKDVDYDFESICEQILEDAKSNGCSINLEALKKRLSPVYDALLKAYIEAITFARKSVGAAHDAETEGDEAHQAVLLGDFDQALIHIEKACEIEKNVRKEAISYGPFRDLILKLVERYGSDPGIAN